MRHRLSVYIRSIPAVALTALTHALWAAMILGPALLVGLIAAIPGDATYAEPSLSLGPAWWALILPARPSKPCRRRHSSAEGRTGTSFGPSDAYRAVAWRPRARSIVWWMWTWSISRVPRLKAPA
jgi:hypothetical protein